MKGTTWGALAALSLGWGTRGVATRAAFGHDVGVLTLVGVRLVIATVVAAAAFVLVTRSISLRREVLVPGSVMAVTNIALPFLFFTIAFQHASAGFVGLMAALTPLATALFAHVLLPEESLSRGKLFGLTVAIAGVAVMLGSGDSGLASGGRPVLATAWSLPGVAAFSFSTVYAKRRVGALQGFDVLVIQFGLGAALAAGPMLAVEGLPRVDGTAWLLLTYLAVASTVAPLLLFYWVLRRTSASQTALVGYMVPIVSVVAGVILLGERAEPGLVIGGAAILIGVVLADRAEGLGARPLP